MNIWLFLQATNFLNSNIIYSTDGSVSAYYYHYLPLMLSGCFRPTFFFFFFLYFTYPKSVSYSVNYSVCSFICIFVPWISYFFPTHELHFPVDSCGGERETKSLALVAVPGMQEKSLEKKLQGKETSSTNWTWPCLQNSLQPSYLGVVFSQTSLTPKLQSSSPACERMRYDKFRVAFLGLFYQFSLSTVGSLIRAWSDWPLLFWLQGPFCRQWPTQGQTDVRKEQGHGLSASALFS